MKLYVVQEIGYRYNDERYTREEGGTPVRAFREKKNAEAEAKELTRKKRDEWRDNEGWDHKYDPIDEAEFFAVLAVDAPDEEIEYATAKEGVKKALAEAKKAAVAAFEKGATELFEKHPGVESFGWTQYTPYFNDGEPCRFSTYTDDPDINGENGWDLPRELDPYAEVVAKFLGQFRKEDFEAMFGDHVRVTVTRGEGGEAKATTKEFSHD